MNRINPKIFKYIAPVFLIVLIALSAGALVVHQGFKYSYHHPEYILKIESGNKTAVIDQYNFREGVAEVNRFRGELVVQEVTPDYVSNLVKELEAREDVTSVNVTRSLEVVSFGLPARLTYGVLGTLMVVIAFIYLFVFRPLSRIQGTKVSLLTSLLLLLGLYSGVFIFTGILSMVSVIYKLTPLSLAAIGIVGLWGVLVMFISLKLLTIPSALVKQSATALLVSARSTVRKLLPATVTGWGVILSGLVVGLGVKFLVDAILIAVGISVVMLAIYHLPLFIHDLFTMGVKVSLPRRKPKATAVKPTTRTEKTTTAESKVSKPTAKLKPRAKSKQRNRR